MAQRLAYVASAGEAAVGFAAARTSYEQAGAQALIRRHDLYFVRGSADGATGLFLLDTGAPGLLLHGESASTAAAVTLRGATGEVIAQRAEVRELAVANLRQSHVQALRLDLSAMRALVGEDVLGVIGFAQLAPGATTVDFGAETISFGESPLEAVPEDLGTTYGFELHGHLPTLSVMMGEAHLRLGFDSGSEVNVLDRSVLPTLSEGLRGRPAHKEVSGVDAGVIRAPYALVRLTLLDDDPYRDRAFAFLPWGGFRQNLPRLDGLLGADFWGAERITLDYGNRQIRTYVAPDESGPPDSGIGQPSDK